MFLRMHDMPNTCHLLAHVRARQARSARRIAPSPTNTLWEVLRGRSHKTKVKR